MLRASTSGLGAATAALVMFGTSGVWPFTILLFLVGFTLYGPDALLSGAGAMDVGGRYRATFATAVISGFGSSGPVVQELVIARMYDYTRPGGSSARYAFAFRGHTEYSIACFWDPAHAEALSAACTQVMTTLQREVA